jgi:DNA-binding NarL/FixJ family response regulator
VAKKITPGLADMVVRVSQSVSTEPMVDGIQQRRQIIADLCRMLALNVNGADRAAPASPLPELSPRMEQTLDRLLLGDSEKQIANRLGLSRHTVHVYVKALYRGFGVSSRGELLAKFVNPPNFAARNMKRSSTVNDNPTI